MLLIFHLFQINNRDKVKLLCSEDESDLILEDELIAIQCVLNKLVKNSKTSERREYLNFLWSCYDSLPHSYVHPTDPTLCVFEDVERFDCNSLFARLGDVISKFLWMEGILPSVHVPGGTDLSVSLLDSDCKLVVVISFLLITVISFQSYFSFQASLPSSLLDSTTVGTTEKSLLVNQKSAQPRRWSWKNAKSKLLTTLRQKGMVPQRAICLWFSIQKLTAIFSQHQ